MFFTFPEDARWNAEQPAVEFGVEIGEYHGVVRVPRRVFQRLLADSRWRRARTACRGCSSACTSSSASGLTSSGPTCAVIDAAGGLWRRSQVRTGLAAGGEWIRTSSSADLAGITGFAQDASLEGSGFEPSVPRERRRKVSRHRM
jgi:hypothetical protein